MFIYLYPAYLLVPTNAYLPRGRRHYTPCHLGSCPPTPALVCAAYQQRPVAAPTATHTNYDSNDNDSYDSSGSYSIACATTLRTTKPRMQQKCRNIAAELKSEA